KTLLLASVAQGSERDGRAGLPILGWLPIIGRLFSTPTKDNSQVDIVIAVTPRVIRAPAILPEDEIERPTGSLAVPTSGLLEAMIIEEEKQELLAMARTMPNNSVVELPTRAPEYIQTTTAVQTAAAKAAAPQQVETAKTVAPTSSESTMTASTTATENRPIERALNLKPIDNSVKTLELEKTSQVVKSAADKPAETPTLQAVPTEVKNEPAASPSVEIGFGSAVTPMKAGEKVRIPVLIRGSEAFRSAVIGLKFNDKKVAVRSVTFGDVFGIATNTQATPFLNQYGKMFVSLGAKDGSEVSPSGTLVFVEIEALVDGRPEVAFDRDVLNFLTPAGKNFVSRIKE
ncbi:MAG: hypothetical protein ABIV21_01770, partial [Pyrinomonadaceae bacterium]